MPVHLHFKVCHQSRRGWVLHHFRCPVLRHASCVCGPAPLVDCATAQWQQQRRQGQPMNEPEICINIELTQVRSDLNEVERGKM